MKKTSLYVSTEDLESFRVLSRQSGRSVSNLIRDAIDDHLKKNGIVEMEAQPKLLRTVDQYLLSEAMLELEVLRQEHPGYRDDQLLLYMLCKVRDPITDLPDLTENVVPYAGEC